jgi:hypothetical protein
MDGVMGVHTHGAMYVLVLAGQFHGPPARFHISGHRDYPGDTRSRGTRQHAGEIRVELLAVYMGMGVYQGWDIIHLSGLLSKRICCGNHRFDQAIFIMIYMYHTFPCVKTCSALQMKGPRHLQMSGRHAIRSQRNIPWYKEKTVSGAVRKPWGRMI